MLAVAPDPGQARRNGQHRLHRDHHPRFQHRVDILAQFQPGLAAIIVRENPERMAITKRAVLQQVPLGKERIHTFGNLGATHPRPDQRYPQLVRPHIGLPDSQRSRIDLARKHRPLQRRVIARDHRKGIQRQDIAMLHSPRRHRIMRAIGVLPRLEPDPGIAILCIRKPVRDLQLHRVAARHRHVDLARADLNRILDRITAHVRHCRPGPDQGNLGGRFMHPLLHGGGCNIDHASRAQKPAQLAHLHHIQMIALIADHLALARHRLDRPPVIVALPVGIGDVVAVTPPPRLPGVDPGRDRHTSPGRHNQRIRPPETAIEKP